LEYRKGILKERKKTVPKKRGESRGSGKDVFNYSLVRARREGEDDWTGGSITFGGYP